MIRRLPSGAADRGPGSTNQAGDAPEARETTGAGENTAMNSRKIAPLLVLMVLAATTVVNAMPLNLARGMPDISTFFVQVDYDAALDTFEAYGAATNLKTSPNGVNHPITPSAGDSFRISAAIDDTGHASAGSLIIEGTTDLSGTSSGVILTGNLADFGFPLNGPGLFEFAFHVSGGDLAARFAPTVGVVLDAQDQLLPDGFKGSFLTGFQNNGGGNANAFAVVPEPLSAVTALVAVGAVTGACARRPNRSS